MATYKDLIEEIRLRTLPIKGKYPGWQADSSIYQILIDKASEWSMKTKDYQSDADLSIVANVQEYDLTDIALDVDEIKLITIDSGEVAPREIHALNREIHELTYNESELTNATPKYFQLWNGKLKLIPIPSESVTAKVYYTVKIPKLNYSDANAKKLLKVNDEYHHSLICKVAAMMYESVGDFKTAMYFSAQAEQEFNDAKNIRPVYGQENGVVYHDPAGVVHRDTITTWREDR